MTLTTVESSAILSRPEPARRLRVALAGNPNCGKTSLFNAPTGARQHVATYPGVTVEKRTGTCEAGGSTVEIVDLPGTYSLSSYSPEERVAEEELASRPDVVVVVVADSMQLQRNLVLLVQILQTGANPVLCLNMADEARATEDLEFSVAGRAGRFLAPAFTPLGFDWKIVTAMIGAFAAKEDFVAQMGIVYSIGDADAGTDGLRTLLARDYSPLVGLSLVLFLLISAPCMATIAVTKRESGRWRWALLQLFGLTAVGYLTSLVVNQLGRLFV